MKLRAFVPESKNLEITGSSNDAGVDEISKQVGPNSEPVSAIWFQTNENGSQEPERATVQLNAEL